MKKLLLSALLASALSAAPVIELSKPFKDATNTVTEVWAYVCGHCAAHFKAGTLERIALSAKLSAQQELSQIMGKNAELLSSAFYYAKYLDLKNGSDKYNQLKAAIFDATLDDLSEYEQIFKQILNKSIKELEAMKTEPWYINFLSAKPSANEVAHVHGTPGYVINGKYLINLAEIKSEAELLELAKELAKKPN